jgi:transcriptional regulator with XRE-family HTH domain
MEIRKTLAHNVRALRSRLGISQEDLADRCGLHRTYVGAIERAERNVTLSTLEVFSEALGVTVPDLLRDNCHDTDNFLTTGEQFFTRFKQIRGQNLKDQFTLPPGFFDLDLGYD